MMIKCVGGYRMVSRWEIGFNGIPFSFSVCDYGGGSKGKITFIVNEWLVEIIKRKK